MTDDQQRPAIHVLYGSQTGNAEIMAMDAADAFTAAGHNASLLAMDEISASDLADMHHLVVLSATYDDGDMPDSAQDLWDALEADSPDLSHARFAVLALGDSSYDDFCAAGRHFDEKLGELGAERVLTRVDCDVDYELTSKAWIKTVVATFGSNPEAAPEPAEAPSAEESGAERWTRQRPYRTTVKSSRRCSGDGSRKAVFHYEVDLADSGITYAPGDSLGLIPVNPTSLVTALVDALGVDAAQQPVGHDLTWRELLTHQVELRLPSRALVTWAGEMSGNAELQHLLSTGNREALESWTWGRDVLDLVTMVPSGKRDAQHILTLLGSVQHRSYSISSSPTDAPKSVDLLVSAVSYHREGRDHVGAGSSTLESADSTGEVAIFLAPNPSFRLPVDDRPIIMIGPGVGVAPFLSFLRERRSRGASGRRSWLFFGDQHESCDFLYRDELEQWESDGVLSRLSTAFSRDQEHKVYVQDRMIEHGADLFAWLEDGAGVYVCGDGTRMSHAVEQTLVDIIAEHGNRDEAAASDYLAQLKRDRRYAQDVY
jgi:sulfite reductase (NADPH) flavoprotein alpha-component